jgi:hypothetical protein
VNNSRGRAVRRHQVLRLGAGWVNPAAPTEGRDGEEASSLVDPAIPAPAG